MVLQPVKAETLETSPSAPMRLIHAGDPIGGIREEGGEKVIYAHEPTIMCDVTFRGVYRGEWNNNQPYFIFEKKDGSLIGLIEEQVNQSIKTS